MMAGPYTVKAVTEFCGCSFDLLSSFLFYFLFFCFIELCSIRNIDEYLWFLHTVINTENVILLFFFGFYILYFLFRCTSGKTLIYIRAPFGFSILY